MFTRAMYETLLAQIVLYREATIRAGRGHTRLFVEIIQLLGSYTDCPEDIADHLENEIQQVYQAAYEGRPIPPILCGPVYTVLDGTIIVVGLRKSFAIVA